MPRLVGDRRAVLLVDDAVAGRAPALDAETVVIAGGEQAKATAQLEVLWRGLAAAELERRDVVVAMGGGAVTDVAGFAAATFRRGLAWIAVPTTLVGQVDAAIGGKTAIDVAAKNDVGAFHLPEAVVADPALLGTLPAREWSAGFAEVVKTALLAGGRLWELVRGWPPARVNRPRGRSSCASRPPTRRASSARIRPSKGCGPCSTSATRSGTASRPRPASGRCSTARRSRSG